MWFDEEPGDADRPTGMLGPYPVRGNDVLAGEPAGRECQKQRLRNSKRIHLPVNASSPQTGKSHQLPVRKCDRIGLLPGRDLLSLAEVIDRNKAAPPLEGLTEGGLALDPLGLGVDVREADFRCP